jgi:bifunctional non-homologous end joining protein LigD
MGSRRGTPGNLAQRAGAVSGATAMTKTTVMVGRRRVEVSSPEKVLYPDDGITKADLADYYRRVAGHMLPYLADRPIALERYPDGLSGERVFQKNVPRYYPEWIARVRVPKQGGSLQHVLVKEPATLVYLANQACLTVHAFLSRADRLRHPDQLIFDLDPPGAEFQLARRVALDLRRLLEEELRLPTFVKTTGGDGLHVMVPLDRSEDFDAVRAFAAEVGRLLARRDPDRVTVEQRKQKRGNRLFVDVMRNAYAQTAVPPYAVRARTGAPVATPLDWEEVRDPRLRPDRFTMRSIFGRLARRPDPWKNIGRRSRSLVAARERLERLLQRDGRGG